MESRDLLHGEMALAAKPCSRNVEETGDIKLRKNLSGRVEVVYRRVVERQDDPRHGIATEGGVCRIDHRYARRPDDFEVVAKSVRMDRPKTSLLLLGDPMVDEEGNHRHPSSGSPEHTNRPGTATALTAAAAGTRGYRTIPTCLPRTRSTER